MLINIRSLYSSWWKMSLIILLIITIGFFVIAAIMIRLGSDNKKEAGIDLSAEKKHDVSTQNNYWIGSANPKVTIVEFADFGCAYCRKEFSIIRALSVKYKNDVKIVFKDYPVVTENSSLLAHSARCAGEQGLFWPMHDKLFVNQGVDTEEGIAELAKQVGANESRFSQCMAGNKYFSLIQKDFEEGEQLGIEGTPTWFINGYKIAGDVPLKTFEEIITYFLSSRGL